MDPSLTLLLVWIAALLGAIVAIYAVWWSLYWDRSRGRLRCPACWHTVNDWFPYRCTECGHFTIFRENLQRTRRRWGWAATALIAMLLGTTWLRDQVSMRGWWTLFPDRVVIALLPLADDQDAFHDIPQYLVGRMQSAEMSHADTLRLVRRCTAGDWWAPPGSDRWAGKYAAIIDLMQSLRPELGASAEEAAELMVALNAMSPTVRLEAPSVWNAVDPAIIAVGLRNRWAPEAAVELRVEGVEGVPISDEARRRLAGQSWERVLPNQSMLTQFVIDLGVLPVGKHAGELRLHWESTLPASVAGGSPSRAEGVVGVPLAIDVHPDPASLQPIDSTEIADLVREAFTPGLLRWPEGRVRHAFSYRAYNTSASQLDPVAFGLIVEALEDGVPRRRLDVWWRGGRGGARAGWNLVMEDPAALDLAAENSHWTMRIRGDEALARRVAGMYPTAPPTQWWSGTVEMPLTIRDRPGEPSARVWMLQRYVPRRDASPAR